MRTLHKLDVIFYCYTIIFGMWSILIYIFIIAYIQGGKVTVVINQFGEANFEILYLIILTVFASIGYYHLYQLVIRTKIITIEKMQLNELIRYNRRQELLTIFVGNIIGLSIAEYVVILLERAEYYIFGVHIHHLYLGLVGAFIFLMYYKTSITKGKLAQILLILTGFFVGIAIHDLFYHIIENQFDLILNITDFISLKKIIIII